MASAVLAGSVAIEESLEATMEGEVNTFEYVGPIATTGDNILPFWPYAVPQPGRYKLVRNGDGWSLWDSETGDLVSTGGRYRDFDMARSVCDRWNRQSGKETG